MEREEGGHTHRSRHGRPTPRSNRNARPASQHPGGKEKKDKKRHKDKKHKDQDKSRFERMKKAAAVLGNKQPRRQQKAPKSYPDRPILPPIQLKKPFPPPQKDKAPAKQQNHQHQQYPDSQPPTYREQEAIVDTHWKPGHPAMRNHWLEGEGDKYPHTHGGARKPPLAIAAADLEYKSQRDKDAREAYRKFNWGGLPVNNFRNSHLKKKKENKELTNKNGGHVARYHAQEDEPRPRTKMPPIGDRQRLVTQTYTETGLREIHMKKMERTFGKNVTVTKTTEQFITQKVTRQQVASHPGNASKSRSRSQPGNQRAQKSRSAPSNSPRLRKQFENQEKRPQSAHPPSRKPMERKKKE